MGVVFAFLFQIWIPFCVSLFPEDQPGCLFRPAMPHFYAYNANLQPGSPNWMCKESFEEKLKICIDVYQRTTQGKVETTYEIIKDKESVNRECEKRKMTFTQVFDPEEPDYVANETVKNVTIYVDMFACPITKLDLQYPDEYLKPELLDIYISLSRNDVTIAALTDSRHLDNICVRDAYLYPPPHLRRKPRTRPLMPEEIRDFKDMNDEYFEKLANRLLDGKMATATGAEIEFYSTMFYQFTRKDNETKDNETRIDETTLAITSSEDTTISQTVVPTTTIEITTASLETTRESTGTSDSPDTISLTAPEISTLLKKTRKKSTKSTPMVSGEATSKKARVTKKATSKKATTVTKGATSKKTKVTKGATSKKTKVTKGATSKKTKVTKGATSKKTKVTKGATKPIARKAKKTKATSTTVSTVSAVR